MGWIKDWVRDQLEKLGDWLWDVFIAPLAEWVRDAIEEIKYWIRLGRHAINELISRWVSTDFGFLTFVWSIALAVVFAPRLAAWLKGTNAFLYVAALAVKVKEKLLKIIDINKVIDWKMLHNILMVLWEDYREAMSAFNEMISQLAAELGEGSAYIHAYLASARGLYMGTTAILGGDMMSAELQWYSDATDFGKRVDDNFKRYAREPGLLYYDFVNYYLQNAYDQHRDVQQGMVDQMRENHERGMELEGGLKLVIQSFDDLVENTGATVENAIRERWDPIKEVIDDALLAIDENLWPIVDGVVAAVEEHYRDQLRINAAYLAAQKSPVTVADAYGVATDEERILFEGMLDYATGESMRDDQEDLSAIGSDAGRRLREITDSFFGFGPVSPALLLEPTGFGGRRLKGNVPTPFPGDY